MVQRFLEPGDFGFGFRRALRRVVEPIIRAPFVLSVNFVSSKETHSTEITPSAK